MRSTLLWLVIGSGGCAYRVALTAEPTSVDVRLPDGSYVGTPAEVVFTWVPFGHQRVIAEDRGYRSLEVDLRKTEIKWTRLVFGTLARPSTLWGTPRGEVRFVLVPEHGPTGSWTAEEVR